MDSARLKTVGTIGSVVYGSLALLLAAGRADALTGTWICGSGDWADPACWSYSGWGSEYPDITPDMMGDGGEALLLSSDDIDRTVTRSSPSVPFPQQYPDYLTIDATGSGTMTLVQTDGHSGVRQMENHQLVGVWGTGTLIQTGGGIGGELRLGVNAGSSGRYDLTGGYLGSEWWLAVGEGGSGLVNQSGGRVDVGGLMVSRDTGSSGTYNMTNGSLLVFYNTYDDVSWIGYAGTGTFNQSGGSHSTETGIALGAKASGQGSYNIRGGNLSTQQFLVVGGEGTGTFTQSGGEVWISGERMSGHYNHRGLSIGYAQQGQGTYNLIDGTLRSGGSHYINANGNIVPVAYAYTDVDIGDNGTGIFNQQGGSLDLTECIDPEACGYATRIYADASGAVNIAKQSGSTGTYNLSGGIVKSYGVNVGIGGQGAFNQSGGSQVVKGTLAVADDTAGGSGVYTMSGGTLNAQKILVNEHGRFNYDGGSVTAKQFSNGGKVALRNPAADTLINGNYIQLATGILQLEGEWSLLDGLDYSRLDISDTALLGGTLDFSLDFDLGGYTPDWSNGDPLGLSLLEFDLFSANSIVGEFDLLELPDLGDLDPFYDWKVSYVLNDFDTDYVRLSMVYTGATAVPTPSTLLLLIPGLAMTGLARRNASQ